MYNFPPHILRASDDLLVHTNPETNAWLSAQVLRGVDPNDMVAAMVEAGRPQEVAALLVNLALQSIFIGEGGAAQDPRICVRTPPETLSAPHAEDHWVDGGDRKVQKLISMGTLDVVLYEGLVSEEECNHIVAMAEPRLQRSRVAGPGMEGIEVPIRTSDGMFLEVGEDPVVATVERRIAAITGVPVSHGEGLQVLRYRGTQEYRPHFDFFEPKSSEEARRLEQEGNRVGTMIVYLSDVERGGSTYFPQLGLSIHPKKGSALWFGYLGEDGVPDMRSEHAGLPVLTGEKWIMTKWLRQKPIPGMPLGVHERPQAGPGFSVNSVVPFPGQGGGS